MVEDNIHNKIEEMEKLGLVQIAASLAFFVREDNTLLMIKP